MRKYEELFRSYIKSFTNPTDIIKTWEKAEEIKFPFTTHTYQEVIRQLTNYKREDLVLYCFDKLKSKKALRPNRNIYNELLRLYLSLDNKDKMWDIFKEMTEIKMIKPNADSYYYLISAYSDSSDVKNDKIIVKIINDMKEKDIEPDSTIYNLLIERFSKRGDFTTAQKYAEEMSKRGYELHPDTYRWQIEFFKNRFNNEEDNTTPGKVTYQTILNMIKWIDQLYQKNVALDASFYNIVIKLISDIEGSDIINEPFDKTEKVFEILKDMENRGIKPDNYTKYSIFNFISLFFLILIELKWQSYFQELEN